MTLITGTMPSTYNTNNEHLLMEKIKEMYSLDTLIMCGPGSAYLRDFLNDYAANKWKGISLRWMLSQKLSNSVVWQYFTLNGSEDWHDEHDRDDFATLAKEILLFMEN